MKNFEQLNLTARFDRRLIGPEGGLRHLVIDVEAPHLPVADDAVRPPLHLGLVVDASGSMSGEPIEAAKTACRGVVEALRPVDRVTLVSFACDVITHAEAVPCDGKGKVRVLDIIDGIGPRGSTDLSGGWEAAVDLLRAKAQDGTQNRIVLLSDGYANAGITDPESLGLRAAGASTHGVFTSCVGIGAGYCAVQLQALAEHGGGRLHHAATSEEIIEVVLGELGEIRRTFAEKVTLSLQTPAGVGLSLIGPLPFRRENGAHIIEMGVLTSGAARRVVVKVELPSAAENDVHTLSAVAGWTRPGEKERLEGEAVEAAIHCAPLAEVAAELPDADVALDVLHLWQRDILRRASLILDEGDRDGARSLVLEELPAIKAMALEFREARPMIRELERFAKRLERHVSARMSKEMLCSTSKGVLCEADVRDSVTSFSDLLEGD